MPELPEVETVRRSLEPHIVGKTIKYVEILHPKLSRDTPTIAKDLIGLTFAPTDRIGKLLIFPFSNDERNLLIHLKMTGQLLYQDSLVYGAGLPAEASAKAGGGHTLSESDLTLPNRHTRAVMTLDNQSTLFFNDMRLFGYVKLVSPDQLQTIKGKYGIEPGQPNYILENFIAIFKKRTTTIKALLLNPVSYTHSDAADD
jgi:formamidopyrimidine-DNA glycosylase